MRITAKSTKHTKCLLSTRFAFSAVKSGPNGIEQPAETAPKNEQRSSGRFRHHGHLESVKGCAKRAIVPETQRSGRDKSIWTCILGAQRGNAVYGHIDVHSARGVGERDRQFIRAERVQCGRRKQGSTHQGGRSVGVHTIDPEICTGAVERDDDPISLHRTAARGAEIEQGFVTVRIINISRGQAFGDRITDGTGARIGNRIGRVQKNGGIGSELEALSRKLHAATGGKPGCGRLRIIEIFGEEDLGRTPGRGGQKNCCGEPRNP